MLITLLDGEVSHFMQNLYLAPVIVVLLAALIISSIAAHSSLAAKKGSPQSITVCVVVRIQYFQNCCGSINRNVGTCCTPQNVTQLCLHARFLAQFIQAMCVQFFSECSNTETTELLEIAWLFPCQFDCSNVL